MATRTLKYISFTIIVFAAVFLLLEGGARIVESSAAPGRTPADPGWQAKFFGCLFDWHEPDPDLL